MNPFVEAVASTERLDGGGASASRANCSMRLISKRLCRDHLARQIAAVLDLSWVRLEPAPPYSDTGRPSIIPELMIRMLILGSVFAFRSGARGVPRGATRSRLPLVLRHRHLRQNPRSLGLHPRA